MTPEVRDRIDQIRQGIVPEGYKKTKSGILPEGWSVRTIAECLERVEHPVEVQANEMYTQIGIRSHGKGLFYKEPVTGDSLGNKSVFWIEPDCFILNIVFAWEQAIGKTTQAEAGMIGSHRFPMYRPINGSIDIDYLIAYLLTKRGTDILEAASPGGAGRNRTLGQDRFMKSRIVLPPLDEQKKIAEILSTQDKAIELQERKIEELKRFKKGCLEKMFPRKGQKVPETRFPGFTGDWEQRKAKELFVSTADKGYPELPVLSATQDRGMIRRDENSINIFHDKKNEAGYKRVLPGQFVIHLRSFQGGFAHSAIEGITSPAYTVFGFSEPEKHDSEYWKYVFTSKSFIQRLETVTYGIRDGRSISYEEFLTLGFVYPSKAEQTAIARYLDKLSDLITLHQRKLEEMKRQKKALMQLLLTGIVRVKT